MSILKNPVVFTANRLRDGESVWLGASGVWVEDINAARVLRNETERDASQALADQADADNIVVEPYAIDVSAQDGVVAPLKFREQIRAAGPTVRLDLGKQAQTHASRAA